MRIFFVIIFFLLEPSCLQVEMVVFIRIKEELGNSWCPLVVSLPDVSLLQDSSADEHTNPCSPVSGSTHTY